MHAWTRTPARSYLEPEEFKELKPLEPYPRLETPAYLKGGTHKGASQHLRAYGVGQLLSVTLAGRTPTEIKARALARRSMRAAQHA
jgi:hypothetical protein